MSPWSSGNWWREESKKMPAKTSLGPWEKNSEKSCRVRKCLCHLESGKSSTYIQYYLMAFCGNGKHIIYIYDYICNTIYNYIYYYILPYKLISWCSQSIRRTWTYMDGPSTVVYRWTHYDPSPCHARKSCSLMINCLKRPAKICIA